MPLGVSSGKIYSFREKFAWKYNRKVSDESEESRREYFIISAIYLAVVYTIKQGDKRLETALYQLANKKLFLSSFASCFSLFFPTGWTAALVRSMDWLGRLNRPVGHKSFCYQRLESFGNSKSIIKTLVSLFFCQNQIAQLFYDFDSIFLFFNRIRKCCN